MFGLMRCSKECPRCAEKDVRITALEQRVSDLLGLLKDQLDRLTAREYSQIKLADAQAEQIQKETRLMGAVDRDLEGFNDGLD